MPRQLGPQSETISAPRHLLKKALHKRALKALVTAVDNSFWDMKCLSQYRVETCGSNGFTTCFCWMSGASSLILIYVFQMFQTSLRVCIGVGAVYCERWIFCFQLHVFYRHARFLTTVCDLLKNFMLVVCLWFLSFLALKPISRYQRCQQLISNTSMR